ncbi:MAG: site-specific integrase, partial [Burkholderiaceae bacterium]|nr:site-specific integrase [Burkholderiaceae bacterium]
MAADPAPRRATRRAGAGVADRNRKAGSTDPLIDAFVDALWLEDGLAANSLAAYRRDLQSLSIWLAGRSG